MKKETFNYEKHTAQKKAILFDMTSDMSEIQSMLESLAVNLDALNEEHSTEIGEGKIKILNTQLTKMMQTSENFANRLNR